MKTCKAARLIIKPDAECAVDFAAALRLVALALIGIIVVIISVQVIRKC